MALARTLALRAATLLGVLLTVLVLLVVTLGATGYSDRILEAVVGEELRGLRSGLAQTIRDPDALERTLEERRKELNRFYGLDEPWFSRLPDTVLRVITLDLGDARTARSFTGSSRISDIILDRLPNTILLLTTSLCITAILGLALGVKMATKVGSKVDRVVSFTSAVSFALPAWWTGILLILVLSYQLQLLPSGDMYSTPPPEGGLSRFLDLLKHAFLPIVTLVLVSVGPYLYSVRTMTINVAQEDHVSVARAKGLTENTVMRRHILRVAAPPIVTGLIFSLIGSLSGSILVETVFRWQGMGLLYFESISGTPDEAVIVALTFVFTLLYVTARFILEVLYLLLDPRVRYT
jgi:peptide/nickel transport system permease protein